MTTLETEQPRYALVIDGHQVEAASGHRYDTVDPFLGAPWASAADGDAEDVNRAVAAARRALTGPWGQLTGFGRGWPRSRPVIQASCCARCAASWPASRSGSTTSPAWPTSSRARRSRWTSRIS